MSCPCSSDPQLVPVSLNSSSEIISPFLDFTLRSCSLTDVSGLGNFSDWKLDLWKVVSHLFSVLDLSRFLDTIPDRDGFPSL